MIPAIDGRKYCSTMLVCGGCVGAGVAGAGSTAKAVTACDGQ